MFVTLPARVLGTVFDIQDAFSITRCLAHISQTTVAIEKAHLEYRAQQLFRGDMYQKRSQKALCVCMAFFSLCNNQRLFLVKETISSIAFAEL